MVLVAGGAIVALVHGWAVGRHYFVGSFDDDAQYLLTARALLHGQGLTGHITSGDPVIGAYPPGFALLLVPFEWAWGVFSFAPMRVLAALCGAAVLPLTWAWMARRQMPDSVRAGVMALLALDPVLATFSTMVMAETPFLVVFLALLLAADRWERTARLLGPTGLTVVVLAAADVWLKEAGIGLVAGMVLWYLARRSWGRAAAVTVGVALSLVPVVVGRLIDGVPLIGSRYSQEIGSYYAGSGLLSRAVHVVPGAFWTWMVTALPRTVAPLGSPLPGGAWFTLWSVLTAQVTVFTMVGFVVAVRRQRDFTVVAVPVYAAGTLFYPYINERRVILVLPVVAAWYALGVRAGVQALLRQVRARSWSVPRAQGGVALLGVVVLLVPLVLQFPRDYLFALGQDSSHPQGSRYMELLAALPSPTTVVETDYRYTTALFSGHRTAQSAFVDTVDYGCSDEQIRRGIVADDPGYLLLGNLNKPWLADSPCILAEATRSTWAVRLLRTQRDHASVFELIGPGTAHPDLRDLLAGVTATSPTAVLPVAAQPTGPGDSAGSALTTTTVSGVGAFTWSLPEPRIVSQVSVGEAGAVDGTARAVAVQIQVPDGAWKTVAATGWSVGAGAGAPFLLAEMPSGTAATAIRVVIRGRGRVDALDVVALGPAPVGG